MKTYEIPKKVVDKKLQEKKILENKKLELKKALKIVLENFPVLKVHESVKISQPNDKFSILTKNERIIILEEVDEIKGDTLQDINTGDTDTIPNPDETAVEGNGSGIDNVSAQDITSIEDTSVSDNEGDDFSQTNKEEPLKPTTESRRGKKIKEDDTSGVQGKIPNEDGIESEEDEDEDEDLEKQVEKYLRKKYPSLYEAEGDEKDNAEDEKLAKESGMTPEEWEASSEDEKHDAVKEARIRRRKEDDTDMVDDEDKSDMEDEENMEKKIESIIKRKLAKKMKEAEDLIADSNLDVKDIKDIDDTSVSDNEGDEFSETPKMTEEDESDKEDDIEPEDEEEVLIKELESYFREADDVEEMPVEIENDEEDEVITEDEDNTPEGESSINKPFEDAGIDFELVDENPEKIADERKEEKRNKK